MYMWEYLESLSSRAWSRMSLLSLSHGHSLEISQHRSLSCMPLRESSAPNEILGDVAKLCHCISNWRSMEMPDRQWCPMFPVFLQFQQLFPQCLSIVFGRCLPLQRTSSGCFPCSGKNTGEWLTTLGFQHLCKRCLFLPIVRCFITGVLATPMPHTNVLQNTAVPSITVFFQATDSVHKLRKNLSIIRGGWRETTSVFFYHLSGMRSQHGWNPTGGLGWHQLQGQKKCLYGHRFCGPGMSWLGMDWSNPS